jgi:hypothetical protein
MEKSATLKTIALRIRTCDAAPHRQKPSRLPLSPKTAQNQASAAGERPGPTCFYPTNALLATRVCPTTILLRRTLLLREIPPVPRHRNPPTLPTPPPPPPPPDAAGARKGWYRREGRGGSEVWSERASEGSKALVSAASRLLAPVKRRVGFCRGRLVRHATPANPLV